MAQLKTAAGIGNEQMDVPEGCTAKKLLPLIAEVHGPQLRRALLDEDNALQATILMFVGETQVTAQADVPLADGSEVTFLAPIAGGGQ